MILFQFLLLNFCVVDNKGDIRSDTPSALHVLCMMIMMTWKVLKIVCTAINYLHFKSFLSMVRHIMKTLFAFATRWIDHNNTNLSLSSLSNNKQSNTMGKLSHHIFYVRLTNSLIEKKKKMKKSRSDRNSSKCLLWINFNNITIFIVLNLIDKWCSRIDEKIH